MAPGSQVRILGRGHGFQQRPGIFQQGQKVGEQIDQVGVVSRVGFLQQGDQLRGDFFHLPGIRRGGQVLDLGTGLADFVLVWRDQIKLFCQDGERNGQHRVVFFERQGGTSVKSGDVFLSKL